MNIIRQEIPSYFTMMFRKSFSVKMAETITFIIIFLVLLFSLGYSNPLLKIGTIINAVFTLGLSPLIYKWIMKPMYILTESELIIRKSNREFKIPIHHIDYAHDLRHFYLLNDKKKAITVSDDFIKDLNMQIDIVKKQKAR